MNKADLIKARDLVKQQFDNLSDPNWVHTQREQLRGKYDILNSLLDDIEKEETNATDSTAQPADSNDHQGS